MPRKADASLLSCTLTPLQRDFVDFMREEGAFGTDSNVVLAALHCLASRMDFPVTEGTFALRSYGRPHGCKDSSL